MQYTQDIALCCFTICAQFASHHPGPMLLLQARCIVFIRMEQRTMLQQMILLTMLTTQALQQSA